MDAATHHVSGFPQAVFLRLHGGGIRGVPVAAGAYGPQLEFNYGRPRAAAGSVFGQVLRGV